MRKCKKIIQIYVVIQSQMTMSCMYLIACGLQIDWMKKRTIFLLVKVRRERERTTLANNLDG